MLERANMHGDSTVNTNIIGNIWFIVVVYMCCYVATTHRNKETAVHHHRHGDDDDEMAGADVTYEKC